MTCAPGCQGCWLDAHAGHDIAMRHTYRGLLSATCFDCDSRFTRREDDDNEDGAE